MRTVAGLALASAFVLNACTAETSQAGNAAVSSSVEGWTFRDDGCDLLLAKPGADGVMTMSGPCTDKGSALAGIVKAHPEALAGASSVLLGSLDVPAAGVFDHCAALSAVAKDAAWKEGMEAGQASLSLSAALSATPLAADLTEALGAAGKKVSSVSAETVIMGDGAAPDCPGALPKPLPQSATIWISLEQK